MIIRILCLVAFIVLIHSCGARSVTKHDEKPLPSHDAYYFYILGYDAEKEGKWENAIEYYTKALDFDLSSSYLKIQISTMFLRMGNITEAVKIAEDVLKPDPDNVQALLLLGELYNAQ